MLEKLEECRDIVQEICCDIEGRYPISLVRVGRLIEEMLEEWREWDENDVATLLLCFPDEPPFPAA